MSIQKNLSSSSCFDASVSPKAVKMGELLLRLVWNSLGMWDFLAPVERFIVGSWGTGLSPPTHP